MVGNLGHKKKRIQLAPIVAAVIVALEAILLTVLVLNTKNFAVFNPTGPVAHEQLGLIVFYLVILSLVAVATLLLLYFFAWKYRETNQNVTYDPHTKHGKFFAFSVWALPSAFMVILVLVMLPATHQLEPRKQITSSTKPLTIQVVAMRWKWVFIYPEQHIATVNYVQVPTNTPIIFELSADEAPMSSFWVPNLGGQLYAMTGHVNTLNLLADKPGDYPGSSAELNGAGFTGMKFVAHADTQESFDSWVRNVKLSPQILDSAEYSRLLKPTENNQVVSYAIAQTNLFDNMLLKYSGAHSNMVHK